MTAATPRKKADAYHHGDLREALLAAAREALESASPEAVTLKALAVRLGVSQPAPYRHFASREALLQAVTADGFLRFTQALEAAEAEGAPEQKMERTFAAYVRFGQANRGVYRLMFASNVMHTAEPGGALGEAAHAAFGFLLRSVGATAPAGRARAVAVWIWSTLHGIVMLDSEGLLAGPPEEPLTVGQVVAELAEAVRARL